MFDLGGHPIPYILLGVNQALKVLGAKVPMLGLTEKTAIWEEWDKQLKLESWESLIDEASNADFSERLWAFLIKVIYRFTPVSLTTMNHPVPFAIIWAFKEVTEVMVEIVTNIETLRVEPQEVDMFARTRFRSSWVDFFDQCEIPIEDALKDFLELREDSDAIDINEWMLIASSPLRRILNNWSNQDPSRVQESTRLGEL